MRSKIVDFSLIALLSVNIIGIAFVARGQKVLMIKTIENKAQAAVDMIYIKESMDEVYGMKAREEAKSYILMDTMIRVFHYAKPHKTPQPACPECDSLIRKGLQMPKRKPGEKTVWQKYLERKNGSPYVVPRSHKHDESDG